MVRTNPDERPHSQKTKCCWYDYVLLIASGLNKNPFENLVGKGENVGNQHFLLFPHGFPQFHIQLPSFQWNLISIVVCNYRH